MILRLLLPFLCLCTISSCVSHKELINFNEERLPYGQEEAIENALTLKIQADDLIRITVSSVDPQASEPFNLQAPAQGGGGGQLNTTNLELFQGYLVDREGNVSLPLLGKIQVAGLTIEQLKVIVEEKLETYLKSPVVTARYLNFKVTVLGEVNTPGMVRLTNTRVTLLDALGLAGDLTDYADRKEVVIIRETSDQRAYERLNLQRKDVFNSEYFYLKQNDVIYVRPIRAKTAIVADPGQRIVSYGSALLSVVTLIIAITSN